MSSILLYHVEKSPNTENPLIEDSGVYKLFDWYCQNQASNLALIIIIEGAYYWNFEYSTADLFKLVAF